MPRAKGSPRPAGSGRQRGTQNRLTRQLKDLILAALDAAGGVEYLTRQAEAQPGAFLALIGRVLPLQVKAGGDEPTMPVRVIHEHSAAALPPAAEAVVAVVAADAVLCETR